MSRMTRSSIKHEPGMEDLAVPSFTTSHTATMPNGNTASRAMSINSRITPAYETETNTVHSSTSRSRTTPMQDANTASSGDSTIADEDVEMNGCTHNTNAPDVEDALQALGQDSRELIRAVQKLKELNIDATIPSLPTFVLVGDQSAGKSSIVEAICDIAVPRNMGVCTRCVFQITTSATVGLEEGWVARVSLHLTHSYRPDYIAQDALDYDNWQKQQAMAVVDFAVIRDKVHLQDVLRRAQLAILNPGRSHTEFTTGVPSGSTKLEFSPNTVSIHITGPGLPELSIVDLPGAINVQGEDDDDFLVEFVEKLIKNYLRDEKTLVLLACSANNDVDVSTGFRYVKACKAQRRCMGVLTKPDLIESERYPLLQLVLGGEKYKLADPNAWFVTKQLTQKELNRNASRHHARQSEQSFFAGQPWNGPFAAHSERFGTPKLQQAMSRKLTELIRQELPSIVTRVQDRIRHVDAELAKLPVPEVSASHTVIREYQALVKLVQTKLSGDDLEDQFRKVYRDMLGNLRGALKSRRPTIKLATPGHVHVIDSEDDNDTPMLSPTPAPTSSKKRKMNSGPASAPARPSRVANKQLVMDLEQISDRYNSGSTDLPSLVNYKVTISLMMESFVGLEAAVGTALDSIRVHFNSMLTEVLRTSLALRRQTLFYSTVEKTLAAFFKEVWAVECSMIKRLIACEKTRPITYQNLKTKEVKDKLKHDRVCERIREYYDTLATKAAKNSKSPRADKVCPDLSDEKKRAECEKLLDDDEYSKVLDAVASVLAYYDIASTHVVDSIAKELDYGLFLAMEKDLDGRLFTALQASNEHECAKLLARDAADEEYRRKLLAERERLVAALDELQGLQ
ncbi:hypothetical protein LTR56_001097 [Elasticomyces elasticus]|nr:hypothetical protein LTR56_001097 [Elasticomyces elasticus]KAK5769019.1 hypothetical protein LTS12_000732 [Elasticomyces elasticus]